jgi:hypothetical protein
MIDPNSPTWLAVKVHVTQKLEQHYGVLRTIGLDPLTTEGVRYAIAELEALLNFGKASNIPSDTEPAPHT